MANNGQQPPPADSLGVIQAGDNWDLAVYRHVEGDDTGNQKRAQEANAWMLGRVMHEHGAKASSPASATD